MTPRRSRRTLLAILLVTALCGLPGWVLIARALQTGEVFSPASGHAQVIAQGVTAVSGETVWRTVFHSLDPGSAAELPAGGPGFILVDTGGVLVDDGGESALLAPAEASFRASPTGRLIPIGERPAGVFAIDLTAPDAAEETGGGIPVYASAPFEAPDGTRDVDLVRDLLEPGESTTVIGNEAPVLILVTLGTIRAEATDGSTASLRVGEAATFSGDIVLTAEGQAPATFVAAVIGREAPLQAAAGTPGATPAQAVGSVQVTVYACPPLVELADASPGACLRDPEAVGLELAAIDGETVRDVGPSSERQGLPTWDGLPGGEYILRAASFKEGFGRFFVRGLEGTDAGGASGYAAEDNNGYVIPIGGDAADYTLEVYVFASGAAATPAAEATAAATAAAPGAPTSVIQVATAPPGSEPTPTATPRATATPRPAPLVTATPRPTESPLVSSTAVARPRQGSIELQLFACLDSIETFDPANCGQAVDGYDVQLVTEDGDIISLEDATVDSDGTITWENLPFGTYLFQQPQLLPGTATYYIPDLPLATNATGYVITIDAEEPAPTLTVFNLPAPAAPTPSIEQAAPADSDDDGISDVDEVDIYGTDPLSTDSDGDGALDGDEVAAGTDPLVAAGEPAGGGGGGDSDGDRLSDAGEADFGTDPGNPDSDGDGYYDGDEVNLETDPLDPTSFP